MKTLPNLRQEFKIRKIILLVVTVIFLFYCLKSNGQTGMWNNGNETTTNADVGVGTLNPDGKTEIVYPLPTINGFVVTRAFNPLIVNPGSIDIPPAGDQVLTNPDAGVSDVNYFNYTDLKLQQFNSTDKPLMLGRILNTNDNTYKNRFIVTSLGSIGLNNDNPRSTLDIISKGRATNSPTALFGEIIDAGSLYTRHIQIINKLSDKGYSDLSEEGDQGIFWTDGTGSCTKTVGGNMQNVGGTNKSCGFVIAPWNHGSDGIKITYDGNIGIGTAKPKSKLDVNGKIFCKGFELTNPGGYTMMKITQDGYIWSQEVKVKVTDPYPDFVFKPDFNLMPLTQLELFISKNKHLPSVPVEKEIAENGIDVGKMNVILLQKVEELTLYVIELNKKIETLEKQVKVSSK